jgi:mannose-6-phosphate isomerase-like protein (cupin superfamily)
MSRPDSINDENKQGDGGNATGPDLDALAQLVAQGRPHSFGYKGEMTDATNLNRKLDLFDEHWQPKIVAQVNDYDVRIVKVKGEFVWHKHDDTDDFFLVLSGRLTIQLRDRDVELSAGELFVVPRGVEHCPRADEPAEVLLIEPLGTTNTGDAGGGLTAEERRI